MDTALLAPSNHDLSLPQEALEQLKTPEDYENAFQTVAEQLNNRVWWIADLIGSYARKFPKYELDIYKSGQQMSQSSYRYYLRTALAFSPEQRNPMLTFSHHYQASWIDEYDPKKKRFVGDRRFQMLEHAADNGLSSRALATIVSTEKRTMAQKEPLPVACEYCHENLPERVREYKLYTIGTPHEKPVRLQLHPDCKIKILERNIENMQQANA